MQQFFSYALSVLTKTKWPKWEKRFNFYFCPKLSTCRLALWYKKESKRSKSHTWAPLRFCHMSVCNTVVASRIFFGESTLTVQSWLIGYPLSLTVTHLWWLNNFLISNKKLILTNWGFKKGFLVFWRFFSHQSSFYILFMKVDFI